MPINRTPFNALVDDDGSGTTGTPWNKTQIAGVLLDPIDAMWSNITPDLVLNASGGLRRDTAGGADTGNVSMWGGGAKTASRGAGITCYGVNAGGGSGFIDAELGNVTGAAFRVFRGAGLLALQIGGTDGATLFRNAAAPAWTFDSTATNGGNLLVTTSGTTVLRVGAYKAMAGAGAATDGGLTAAGDMYLQAGAGASSFWVQGQFRPHSDNVYDLGSGAQRWRTVYAGTGTINTSDLRAKHVLEEDCPGLDLIRALRPLVYRWRDPHDDGRPHYGLGAQDVLAVAPAGAFVDTTDPDHLGLNYCEVIAPLIRAVQELAAQVTTLRNARWNPLVRWLPSP